MRAPLSSYDCTIVDDARLTVKHIVSASNHLCGREKGKDLLKAHQWRLSWWRNGTKNITTKTTKYNHLYDSKLDKCQN